jgi:aminoacrylate peracid reductase
MTWTPITPAGSAPPLAPYVSGTRAGNTVYVSGTLAMDERGQTVGVGDVRAQTRSVLEAIRKVLLAAGGDLEDIACNQIFLKDRADYAGMNEVYREYFGTTPPARYCVFCELVRPEFLVEIASVAHIETQPS